MRFLVGILVGLVLAGVPVYAYRMEKPGTINEWNSNTFTQLNNILLQLWNITNGRYQLDRVTSDPDGTLKGDTGQPVLWMNGASASLCANTGTTATDWDCVALTD